MSLNLPNRNNLSGDLARVKSQEPNEEWPEMLELVAYFGPGRKKRRSVEIPADQFYGRGGYGAPMSGDQLILMINKLRRTNG